MLLIKNPAGANEVVRTLVDGGAPSLLLIALNDAIADGRDVSWIWDVDFEPLLAGLERLVATGRARRRARAAVQVRRAGGGRDRGRAVARATRSTAALELTPAGGELVVLPTYTAMLALRGSSPSAGSSRPYWERRVKIVVGHLYPEYLNIYADRGNIAVLARRAAWRGHELEVRALGPGDARPAGRARPLLHRRRPGPRAGADRA